MKQYQTPSIEYLELIADEALAGVVQSEIESEDNEQYDEDTYSV